MTNHLLMLAPDKQVKLLERRLFLQSMGNGQARRVQQRYSGARGSPVRLPRRPAGLIAEVEGLRRRMDQWAGWLGRRRQLGEWWWRRLGQSPELWRRRITDQPLVSVG